MDVDQDEMQIDSIDATVDFEQYQLLPSVIIMLQSISKSDKDGAVRAVSLK